MGSPYLRPERTKTRPPRVRGTRCLDGRRALGVVGEHASRLAQLLDGVLALSGPDRPAVDPAAVDMAALVRDAVESARRADPDRDVLVSVGDLAPATGDSAVLRELAATLIGNAFASTRASDHPCIDVGSIDAGTPVTTSATTARASTGRQAERLFPAKAPVAAHQPDGAGLGLGIVSRSWSGTAGVWAEGGRATVPRSSSRSAVRRHVLRAPPCPRRSQIDPRPVLTRRFGT
jgi:light-regulated signal transduction histidine kinase (bacteriophytochrome)